MNKPTTWLAALAPDDDTDTTGFTVTPELGSRWEDWAEIAAGGYEPDRKAGKREARRKANVQHRREQHRQEWR